MYHRFNEPKYPSTNVQMDIFKEQIKIIESSNAIFIDPNNLDKEIPAIHKTKSILLTIDDGFSSFYKNAWPYLKNKKIPFILFISTREIGKNGYMTWDQIREVQNSKIGIIGNHSHTHDYLVNLSNKKLNSLRHKIVSVKEINLFMTSLRKLGYPAKSNIFKNKLKFRKLLIKAFQRRFRPELINGKIDQECLLIINKLRSNS